MSTHQLSENREGQRVHPQKFALWVGIACIIMMFAALTSSYIVQKASKQWQPFEIPNYFIISAAVMLLSSFTIHWASVSFRNDKLSVYRLALGITFLLSIGFLISQYLGWQKLSDIGIYLGMTRSGDFVRVISYMHFAHVTGGIIFIFIALVKSLTVFSNPANFLIYRTDSNKSIRIGLLATYWHFVDALWLYLLVFFWLS